MGDQYLYHKSGIFAQRAMKLSVDTYSLSRKCKIFINLLVLPIAILFLILPIHTAKGTASVIQTSTSSGYNSSHVINLPSNLTSGNTLIAIVESATPAQRYNADNTSWPAGWTELMDMHNQYYYYSTYWYYAGTFSVAWREVDGTQGTTVTPTTDTSYWSAIVYEISGAVDPSLLPPEAAEAGPGTVNPPALTPTGGSKDYLWIATEGHTSTDTISAYPTNYTSNQTYKSYSGSRVAAATREYTSVSEDPGSFTLSGSGSAFGASATIAVYPYTYIPCTSISIAAGADDGYYSFYSSTFNSSNTYIFNGESGGDADGWYRFANVPIPKGSTVYSAKINFISNTSNGGTLATRIYGVDEDNHVAPTDYATWNADHGIHTSAYAAWTDTIITSAGIAITTSNFASVVQEIIDRAGWASNNAIGIHIDDNGGGNQAYQLVASYEHATYTEPTLTVCYTSPAGITITESDGTTVVTEGGATDSYTVVLDSQPTANVTVPVTDDSQVDTDKYPSLVFTTSNWSTPQTVTVTATNDSVDEDDHTGTIVHTPVTSSDSNYAGISVNSVVATVHDNDTAGIIVTESDSSTVVTEGGATDSYTVVLSTQPTASVTVPVTEADAQFGTDKTSLTFTTENWSTPQTVTVTAVDDETEEEDYNGTITHTPVTSTDGKYAGISVASVGVLVHDNDAGGTTGDLESATFDTGVSDGFIINSIMWSGTDVVDTSVSFQLAVSTSTSGSFTFFGPNNCSEALTYGAEEPGIPVAVESACYHPYESGYRYFRYKVFIDRGTQASSPVVDDIIINWSP